ncbi:DMP19 family protein [Taklimakanibacter lacteus]|uniref:DMP19 family protein n=1 Tax=Taklimakanibacter lacteus TaxID=2268456 RepID=UPI0013C508A9
MILDATEMNRRLLKLAENPHSRLWRLDYDHLSPPERVFRAVWELEAEVNNGGFHQYFFNSAGNLAHHVVEALRAIGATAMAGIAQRAIKAAGYDASESHQVRRERVAALAPEPLEMLDALDQEFYAYPDNLTALLYEYVTEHSQEMGLTDAFFERRQPSRRPDAKWRLADLFWNPYFLLAIIIAIALLSKLWSSLS